MIEQYKDLNLFFKSVLCLDDPWFVYKVQIEKFDNIQTLHLWIDYKKKIKFSVDGYDNTFTPYTFTEKKWRHLNFFQHICILHAKIPQILTPDNKYINIEVPWARKGSGFTLLFELNILIYCKEMPINSYARIINEHDTRLTRFIDYIINKHIVNINLCNLKNVILDETQAANGHDYVTIFIDADRKTRPVIFAVDGKDSSVIYKFYLFMQEHNGNPENIKCFSCDMSPAFLSGIHKYFPNAEITIDFFHVIQAFNNAVDSTRKMEEKEFHLPPSTKYAILKNKETIKTDKQNKALQILKKEKTFTYIVYNIKENLRKLCDIQSYDEVLIAYEKFIDNSRKILKKYQYETIITPIEKAFQTLIIHKDEIFNRWKTNMNTTRMESLNSLFQAARFRAKGYKNKDSFIRVIYLIAAPLQELEPEILEK